MEGIVLSGDLREKTGKGDAKRIRREGGIPAVIYGKKDPLHIQLNSRDFRHQIRSIAESGLITIKVGKKKHTVLIKDYQENPLNNDITHLDFFEITKGEKLHTSVYVILENGEKAKGVKVGGLLEHILYELEIECLPKDIPEHIVCDVQNLDVNENITVADLPVPSEVRVLTDPDRIVATITHVKVVEEAEEGEEVAEVEVIGAEKEQEED